MLPMKGKVFWNEIGKEIESEKQNKIVHLDKGISHFDLRNIEHDTN